MSVSPSPLPQPELSQSDLADPAGPSAGHPPAGPPSASPAPASPAPADPTSPDLTPADVVARLRAAGCVFAEDEARLLIGAARTPAELAAMTGRRVAGLPLEHVLGWAQFCGLRIAVDPGVFVPRRRTEFLVAEAIALARRSGARVVVDMCCGSGALGVALAAAVDDIELHASDIDPAAVRCARRNVAAVGGRVYEGDLFEPLPAALRGKVGILLANVPYVPTAQVALLPVEAREHEAYVALNGGPDGLDVLRMVTAGAPRWLAPGGHLLAEVSDRQAQPAAAIVAGAGLVPRLTSWAELRSNVIVATMPPAGPAP